MNSVVSGILMMVGAVVWFVVGLAFDYIFFYPPILFIIGLVTFGRGLFFSDPPESHPTEYGANFSQPGFGQQFPQQGYPQQGFPQQGFPHQGYPQPGQPPVGPPGSQPHNRYSDQQRY